MELRKYRWSKDYESAEEELVQLFNVKNIESKIWHGEPAELFPVQTDDYDKTIWCAEGSLSVTANGGKALSLQPGDALDVPAFTALESVAGINGCVCYESVPRTK